MIGYVWPEPISSAAGLRDLALIGQFLRAGWKVHYASPAKPGKFSEMLEIMGVPTFSCEANDPRFDAYVRELQPDVVLFDRFVIEEQFGWRVEENCPDAVRILDMQDFHSLRRARGAALEAGPAKGWTLARVQDASQDNAEEVIEQFAREDLLRELSAIYRSDLTLVISSFEMRLLLQRYRVPSELLLLQRLSYGPWKEKSPARQPLPSFEERRHFVSIGNFRHPPNADALRWLRAEIWPKIRKDLPEAELHLYGAYPSREMMEFSDAALGFIVKGPVEDQYATLRRYRALLAPLRYGAGIKGKISDAWSVGTPVVSTPIGAEGMVGDTQWPGEVAGDELSFAESACALYSRPDLWRERSQEGLRAIARYYDAEANRRALLGTIRQVKEDLPERRRSNRIGAMLRQDMRRGTKYFSKWIELKQSLKP